MNKKKIFIFFLLCVFFSTFVFSLYRLQNTYIVNVIAKANSAGIFINSSGGNTTSAFYVVDTTNKLIITLNSSFNCSIIQAGTGICLSQFSTTSVNNLQPSEVVTNSSDFWILFGGTGVRVIGHTTISGSNYSDGVNNNTIGIAQPVGLTMNSSNFFVLSQLSESITAFNFSWNFSYNFSISSCRTGSDFTGAGLTMNSSNFFVLNNDVGSSYTEICKFSNTGTFIDRINLRASEISLTDADGIATINGSDFWITESLGTTFMQVDKIGQDFISPNINITYPLNNSNITNSTSSINYTISDNTGLDICWWTNNSGTTNHTINCGTNITSTWLQGINNVTIYTNDTYNNLNSSSIIFNVDSIKPDLTVYNPKPDNSETFDSTTIPFNFLVNDTNLDSCWFNNDSDSNNRTVNCNTNFTFKQTDGKHTVYFWVNDTYGNINNITINYSVSTLSPSINLLHPTINQWLNYTQNIIFNFTAQNANGIKNCSLFGNFTGTWKENQTNITASASTDPINYTFMVNISDGFYKWNAFCREGSDTNSGWAIINNTFGVDTIKPYISQSSISITTVAGSQTVSFNITSYSELNCNNSFYSVYNSIGNIDNSISNISLTSCSYLNSSFTVFDAPPNSYTLRVYMRDKAGNENYTDKNFSTLAISGIVTGGGGVYSEQKIPVIGLMDINISKEFTELERMIIYATMNNFCSTKLKGETLAIADYSKDCTLLKTDLIPISETIKNYGFSVTTDELALFFLNYKNGRLFQGFATQQQINDYNLFTSVLGLTNFLVLIPPSVDKPVVIYSDTPMNISSVITSNKPLKYCEVLLDTSNFDCIVSNNSLRVIYKIKDPNFISQIVTTQLSVTTDAPLDKVEQKKVSITYRIYNFKYILTNIPFWLILSGIAITFVLLFTFRTKFKYMIKFILP